MFCVQLLSFLFCFIIPQLSGIEIPSHEGYRNLLSDMDAALHLLTRSKISFSKYLSLTKIVNPHRPVDCEEVLLSGSNKSGVYTIWPRSRVIDDNPLQVFCDMDTNGGGWIVLQRRGDFKRPIDYFNKDWESYKKGFGDVEKEFWIGNDNIFSLTNQRACSVRFDMETIRGVKKYALYDSFWIENEDRKYTLHIKDYSGDAGDSMTYHHKKNFSTNDQDNDLHNTTNCANFYKGGWWYSKCYDSMLNGLHHRDVHDGTLGGVHWWTITNLTESLAATEIKIRPKLFTTTLKVLSNSL